MSKLALTTVGFILVCTTGCSTEVAPADDAVRVSVDEGTTALAPSDYSYANLYTNCDPEYGNCEENCTGVTTASMKAARKLLSYVLGNDAGLPAGSSSACTKLRSALTTFRSLRANGTFPAPMGEAKMGSCVRKGYRTHYTFTAHPTSWDASAQIDTMIRDINNNTDACVGAGTVKIFMPSASYEEATMDNGNQETYTIVLDPEPARLTATLGSSSSATAAAVTQVSNEATTAVKWPSSTTYSSCGSKVPGTPCSVIGNLPSGTVLNSVLVKHPNGSNYCRCEAVTW